MAIVTVTHAFNKETAIGSVIARTRQRVGKVLTLDEGSADNTNRMAGLMGVMVLRHLKSVCKGMVLQATFCFSGKYIPTFKCYIEMSAFNPFEKGLSSLYTIIRCYYRVLSSQQRIRLFQYTGGDEKCLL